MKIYSASITAPVNLAVIKYWGKRDANLNLPSNSSISVTLDQDDLRAYTTACCSENFERDRVWVNGYEESVEGSKRMQACLKELRKLRAEMEEARSSLPRLSAMAIHIVSENNFPTAAGLASSAAGFAAFVQAVANLFTLQSTTAELSRIARQGSGSACRSLHGGYVLWEMGQKADGSDSQALQVAAVDHWPEMRALILVASSAKKAISSTSGMQSTVATSKLFETRVNSVVPARVGAMKRAIINRDFQDFAILTMQDSNQFHAVCLDTMPPIMYLNDTSRAAIQWVQHLNNKMAKYVAAYTFDAGPNAVIFYLEKDESIILGNLKSILPHVEGMPEIDSHGLVIDEQVVAALQFGVQRVILTRVGEGPKAKDKSLVNDTGFPT